MHGTIRPYTILRPRKLGENRGEIDQGYLVYNGKEMPLAPTEYAIVQGLLEDGINLEDAGEERGSLRTTRFLAGVITDSVGNRTLFVLRKKIRNFFSGDLVIFRQKGRSGRAVILTRQERKNIRRKVQYRVHGIYIVLDKHNRRRLFINRKEVLNQKGRPLGPQQLALFSLTLFGIDGKGVDLDSQAFQNAWRSITGYNNLSRSSAKVQFSTLRHGLKNMPWTIPCAPVGRRSTGDVSEGFRYSLIRQDQPKRPKYIASAAPFAAMPAFHLTS